MRGLASRLRTHLSMTIFSKILGGGLILSMGFSLWTEIQLNGARAANQLLIAQRDAALAQKATCSGSVDNFKALSDEKQKEAAPAIAAANAAAVTHVERAATILKEVPVLVPSAPDAQCTAALDLLRKYQ